MFRRTLWLIVLMIVALVPSLALTQEARQGTGAGRRAGRPEAGQMQRRLLADVKQRLDVSGDEWKTLMPKVEKVMTARRALAAGMERPGGPMDGAGQRGPGGQEGERPRGRAGQRDAADGPEDGQRPPDGGRGPNARRPQGPPNEDGRAEEPAPVESKVAQALHDLRMVLEEEDAGAEDVAAKLAAYRQIRDKARADLKTAQDELKTGLAPRHEAVLVSINLLD